MIWVYVFFAIVILAMFYGMVAGYNKPSLMDDKDLNETVERRVRAGVFGGAILMVAGALAGLIIGTIGNIAAVVFYPETDNEFQRELAQTGGTWLSIRPEGEYNYPHYSYFLTDTVNGEPVIKNYSAYVDDSVTVFPTEGTPRIVYKQHCEDPFWVLRGSCSTYEMHIYVPKGTPIPQQS